MHQPLRALCAFFVFSALLILNAMFTKFSQRTQENFPSYCAAERRGVLASEAVGTGWLPHNRYRNTLHIHQIVLGINPAFPLNKSLFINPK